jgi:LCP family protein required for cell wall assembly
MMKHIDKINKVIAGFVAISYGLAVYGVLKTGILPLKFLLVAIFFSLVVVALLVFALVRNKQRTKIRSGILIVFSILVIAASGYAFMISRSTTKFLQSSTSTSNVSTETVITEPYVVYISGIDTYGDVAVTSRSDVNIVAVVNPKDKKVLLVNTPRDYYVQLHGTTGTKDKLTHAGNYGIEMSKNTLQDLYGTEIDYTLRINFTSLLKVIDAVGEIEVQSDVAFSAGGYDFVQGVNKLDSKQALVFARERYSFNEGDRQRGKNQQQVITALINKLSSPSTFVNYQKLLKSLDGTFQTNASSDEVSSLIRQQIDYAGSWTTESISVDGSGASAPTYSGGATPLYVMIPDINTVNAAKAAIKSYQTDSGQ